MSKSSSSKTNIRSHQSKINFKVDTRTHDSRNESNQMYDAGRTAIECPLCHGLFDPILIPNRGRDFRGESFGDNRGSC